MKNLLLAVMLLFSLSTVCIAGNDPELKKKAMEANSNVDTSAPDFSATDAAATAKEAKARAKALKKVKAANDKLAKNQKEIANLEKKMQKVQSRLDKLSKKIEFVDQ